MVSALHPGESGLGLTVSALHPGESGLGFSLGGGHCVVFLAKTHNCRSASLSTQMYTWIPVNFMLGVSGNPALD